MLHQQLKTSSFIPTCLMLKKRVHVYTTAGYHFKVIQLPNGYYLHFTTCVSLHGNTFVIWFKSQLPF